MEDPQTHEKKESAKKETEQTSSNYASYFSLLYWSDHFDVNQTEIYERLSNTMNPQKMNLAPLIKTKPDLYAPFWICSTLIFSIFAFGNLSRFLVGHDYNYEFISSACSLFYGFIKQLLDYRASSHVFFDEIPKRRRSLFLC